MAAERNGYFRYGGAGEKEEEEAEDKRNDQDEEADPTETAVAVGKESGGVAAQNEIDCGAADTGIGIG